MAKAKRKTTPAEAKQRAELKRKRQKQRKRVQRMVKRLGIVIPGTLEEIAARLAKTETETEA